MAHVESIDSFPEISKSWDAVFRASQKIGRDGIKYSREERILKLSILAHIVLIDG